MFNEVLGREVNVPEVPKRIISFSPSITETLFLLGLEEAIVGVTAFCVRPAEARQKRRVGSYNNVREDTLDGLKPDLIFTVSGYQREFAQRLSERYPVYPLELPVTVAAIADLVTKVGLVVGAAAKARELSSSLLKRLASVSQGPSLRTYVEIELGGPVSFGAYSYITDAVRFLGSSSLFEDAHAEWLTPDLEAVRESDPDVIFYEPKMFSKLAEGELERIMAKRRWEEMKAVRSGNLFVTPGPLDFLAHHGPSFITDALPWLARKLGEASAKGP